MRKINAYIFMTSLFLLTTCFISCIQQSRDQLIVGKWKFDHIDIGSMTKGRELSPSDELELSFAESMLKGLIMEFFNDKTMDMSLATGLFGGGTVSGTYRFESDFKYLITEFKKKSGQDKIERKEILSLTNNELVLKDNKGIVYVYKKK